MWGTLKAIFTTPTKAGDVANAVIKGADAAWFTKEEQSEWFLRYLEATQPQNLSRRLIAMMVAFVWTLSSFSLLLSIYLGITPLAVALLQFMDTVVNPVFYLIVGFYFGKQVVQAFPRRTKKEEESK